MNNLKVLGECFKAQFGEGYSFKALFEQLGKWLDIIYETYQKLIRNLFYYLLYCSVLSILQFIRHQY